MVGRYIPTLMVLGAVLAAYRIVGIERIIAGMTAKQLADSYDYIIVGGGTSGAVLAERLTDDEGKEVLLIEAGGDAYADGDEFVDIPIYTDKMRGSKYDWGYRTVPQKFASKGMENNTVIWPSGKGLGGTSLINYMQYLRANRHDFDEWAANGATGWAYKDVLPYFIGSEDNRNGEYIRTVFHGHGGRWTVTDIEQSTVGRIVTEAFKELGMKKRDVNGRSQYGYMPTQATIRNGVRWSTYKAFLTRALKKDNLYVLKNTRVDRVIFKGKHAIGVQFKDPEGKDTVIKAKKEIILAAGTVGTPRILLLSGVGPRNHLQQLKIPVVADLPVGDNLQDQVMTNGIEYFTNFTMSLSAARSESFMSAWQYTLYGGGMKQSPRFREGVAFLRTRHQPLHIKYPLIALHIVANVDPVYNFDQINAKKEVWKSLHDNPPTRDGLTVFPVLLHPRSRGNVRLQSRNPEDDVLINPNYLAEDADVKVMVEAVKYARRLGKTNWFNMWELQLSNKTTPQCAKLGNWNDASIECFVRQITLSGYSPVGTCRMGAAGDPTAVVDPILRVRGVKGLRVVDTSIIPASISGNNHATVVMIAEKAADLIRERDSVRAIKDYFKHLIAIKHEKFQDEKDIEDAHSTAQREAQE
jgi:choline dehydrogenase